MRTVVITLFTAFWICASPGVTAAEKTTPKQIRAAAEDFLKTFSERVSSEGRKVEFETGPVDQRLRLAGCESPLGVEFTRDPYRSERQTLQVSCSGPKPWRMFLGVTLRISGTGYVASRSLGRETRLTPAMLKQKTVQLNGLGEKAIREKSELVGMTLNRSVNAGTVLTPRMLSTPDAVVKGDHVMISAVSGSFRVSSRGRAKGDAQVGEQVLVENLSSSRTIRARVVGPGKVEIPM